MQTVGERLRNTREYKGLTLKDIENVTNIRSLYLQAIEEGNYAVLPGEAYVKGFIRNYANALGLNGAEYVDLYRQDQQPIVAPTPANNEKVVPKAPAAPETPAAARPISTRRRRRSRKAEMLWLVLLAFLIICGGFWWYNSVRQDDLSPQTSPQVQQQPLPTETAQQQPLPTEAVQQQPLPIEAAPQLPVQAAPVSPVTPAVKPVVIEAKFVSPSWVQVRVDGKQVYEGIQERGKSMTWQAEQEVTLRVGNAGGVELSYNGQLLGRLGNNGEVIVRTFTKAGSR